MGDGGGDMMLQRGNEDGDPGGNNNIESGVINRRTTYGRGIPNGDTIMSKGGIMYGKFKKAMNISSMWI